MTQPYPKPLRRTGCTALEDVTFHERFYRPLIREARYAHDVTKVGLLLSGALEEVSGGKAAIWRSWTC